MGVWIEIAIYDASGICTGSHPLWVCGLKSLRIRVKHRMKLVTPFMGVWIEILVLIPYNVRIHVTPFMGVWIEILVVNNVGSIPTCHTLYGCVD